MKNFNKIELLDKVNNIEVKKTINKLLDGLISMEKRKNIYVSDFLTPLEFNFAYKIISKLDIDYDIIIMKRCNINAFCIFVTYVLFILKD